MTDVREAFLARFRWIDGHADVLGLFADPELLASVGAALVAPFAGAGIAKVAAVEARGFVLGTAAALAAGVGFVPIRKAGAVHPGAKASVLSEPDWRGRRHELLLQRNAVSPGERILLVDDWAEVGSQALAGRSLVEACGGEYVGLSLLVDQLADDVRARLAPVAALARHDELPSG